MEIPDDTAFIVLHINGETADGRLRIGQEYPIDIAFNAPGELEQLTILQKCCAWMTLGYCLVTDPGLCEKDQRTLFDALEHFRTKAKLSSAPVQDIQ